MSLKSASILPDFGVHFFQLSSTICQLLASFQGVITQSVSFPSKRVPTIVRVLESTSMQYTQVPQCIYFFSMLPFGNSLALINFFSFGSWSALYCLCWQRPQRRLACSYDYVIFCCHSELFSIIRLEIIWVDHLATLIVCRCNPIYL